MQFRHQNIALIFNPTGGSARSGKIAALVQALTERNLSCEQLTTTAAPGSARDLAQEAASRGGIDLVIACGGDGTVCQVAEGLSLAQAEQKEQGELLPMAVFPSGTGNLFARAFYAVPDPQLFADMICRSEPQPIDMIEIKSAATSESETPGFTTQRYIVAGGFGRLSDAIALANPKWKRWFGSFAYAWGMLKASFNPQPVKYRITAKQSPSDGTPIEMDCTAAALFALNTLPPQIMGLSRGCNASDGFMDLVLLKANSFGRLSRLSYRFMRGRVDLSRDYVRIRCGWARIETSRPVLPNIDGDAGAETSVFELRTIPGAARIIVS